MTQGSLLFLAALLLLLAVFLCLWSANASEPQSGAKMQGPDEGELVKPPSRNVTPGFQLSPLHQTAPLRREQGKIVPAIKVPVPEIPRLFRKPVVVETNQLVVRTGPGKQGRERIIQLAHVHLPDASYSCWRFDRQLSCRTLGKSALQRFLRRRAIVCDPVPGSDVAGAKQIQEAICYTGPGILDHKPGKSTEGIQDLAGWLVSSGWLLPDGEHYAAQNALAKVEKLGIYAVETNAPPLLSAPDPVAIPGAMEKIPSFPSNHVIMEEAGEDDVPSSLPSLIGDESWPLD